MFAKAFQPRLALAPVPAAILNPIIDALRQVACTQDCLDTLDQCLNASMVQLGYSPDNGSYQGPCGLWNDCVPMSEFRVDFHHPQMKVGIEVEKKEQKYMLRNIIKLCSSEMIEHALMLIPLRGSTNTGIFNHFNNVDAFLSVHARLSPRCKTFTVLVCALTQEELQGV